MSGRWRVTSEAKPCQRYQNVTIAARTSHLRLARLKLHQVPPGFSQTQSTTTTHHSFLLYSTLSLDHQTTHILNTIPKHARASARPQQRCRANSTSSSPDCEPSRALSRKHHSRRDRRYGHSRNQRISRLPSPRQFSAHPYRPQTPPMPPRFSVPSRQDLPLVHRRRLPIRSGRTTSSTC